jgi:hypothetical protein
MMGATMFQLVGHDCPMGRYPAPVVPIGTLDGALVAIYVSESNRIEVVPVDQNRDFIHHSESLRGELGKFNYRGDCLFALAADRLLVYRSDQQARFFADLLRDSRFVSDDPFFRYSLAKTTHSASVILTAVRECIEYLQTYASAFVDQWYYSVRSQVADRLPGTHLPMVAGAFLAEHWPPSDPAYASPPPRPRLSDLEPSPVALAILRDEHSSEHQPVLNALLARLWEPLQAYARSFARNLDSEDVVQGFLLKSIESSLWSKYDPGKGPFNRFVLGAFRNYTTDQLRSSMALRRGPSPREVPLDFGEDGPTSLTDDSTPEAVFHREWLAALLSNLLSQTLLTLEERYAARERAMLYRAFRDRVVTPCLSESKAPPLRVIAQRIGMTERATAKAVSSVVLDFQREFIRELRKHVESDEESQEILDELLGHAQKP